MLLQRNEEPQARQACSDAVARRDTDTAALRAVIRKLDAQQNPHITELEDLPTAPGDSAAMGARIRDRFTELHAQLQEAEAKPTALEAPPPRRQPIQILDEIPCARAILPGLPPVLKARLFAAFDVNVLWNTLAPRPP